MGTDLIIERVDKARLLLVEAKDAPAAKQVVDIAHAAETYARRQKLSEEVISNAREIRCDAESLLGRFLKSEPKNEGVKMAGRDKFGGARKEPPKAQPPTLSEIGITKKESARAQFIAEIEEKAPEKFEAYKRGKKSIASLKRESRNGTKPKGRKAKPKPEVLHTGDVAIDVDIVLTEVMHAVKSMVAAWPKNYSLKRVVIALRNYADTLEQRDSKRVEK